ncbi:MAG: phage terminase large subunit family protein, partial [Candidatus Thorarchaeota archaeon]
IPLSKGVWSDRFSDEWIERKKTEYINAGMLREYKQEFELILTDDETRLFEMNKVQFIDEDSVPSNLTWFIVLDGAFSEKDSADYSAFACVGVDEQGRWFCASYDIKGRPQDVISKLFELQAKYGAFEIGIEKGQFLLSMKSEIDEKMLDYQQYFTVNELSTTGSKISRIKALAPIINSGRMTIIDTGESAERLVEQLELTDSLACMAKHDDHIDALCQVIQLPMHFNYEAEEDEVFEELDEFSEIFTR